jgi:hypothetical protein
LPQWKKRYVVFQSPIDIPKVGIAAVAAEKVSELSKYYRRKRAYHVIRNLRSRLQS